MTRITPLLAALTLFGCNNAVNSTESFNEARIDKLCTWHTELGCTTTYADYNDCVEGNTSTDNGCGQNYEQVFDKDAAEACLDSYDQILADSATECPTAPEPSEICINVTLCEPVG